MISVPLLLEACSGGPFYFIQMADTQIGMIEGGKNGNNFRAESRILEKVYEDINAMTPKPAFMVVCGDLTNLPGHALQIQEYRRLADMLDPEIRLCNVPGNHDFKGSCDHANLSFYRQTYGPDRYSFDHGGWHFVALNSHLIKFSEKCPEEAVSQLDWCREDLMNAAKEKGTIVFMHHPFFDNDIAEEDGYHNIPADQRHKWLDLFAANNVKAVFSGHRHTTIPEHEYRGVALVNTNAICNSFDKKPGLRIVGLLKDGVRQSFIPRDTIPVDVSMLAKKV